MALSVVHRLNLLKVVPRHWNKGQKWTQRIPRLVSKEENKEQAESWIYGTDNREERTELKPGTLFLPLPLASYAPRGLSVHLSRV